MPTSTGPGSSCTKHTFACEATEDVEEDGAPMGEALQPRQFGSTP